MRESDRNLPSQRDEESLSRFLAGLPVPVQRAVAWLRRPRARWLRIPLAVALILGGLVGFLPILGFRIVPLGVLLLAQDVPILRRPVLRTLAAVQRWWDRRRARGWLIASPPGGTGDRGQCSRQVRVNGADLPCGGADEARSVRLSNLAEGGRAMQNRTTMHDAQPGHAAARRDEVGRRDVLRGSAIAGAASLIVRRRPRSPRGGIRSASSRTGWRRGTPRAPGPAERPPRPGRPPRSAPAPGPACC